MNSAIIAWVGLAVVIAVYAVAYYLWADATGHITMSAQFHTWLFDQVIGPLIVALWFGVPIGLFWHFDINR